MPEISRFYGIVFIEWAALHQDALQADWDRAKALEPLDKIDPLP